ncbi:AMP-binding protein [Actinomarinicola tropica]|uniref:AMP-binding protein n=1 Tax=Actinomarinicola tropica TaxID=2789776 RepID=A0A5Q2RK85_9ACTN|nr:AMP-binding protein [Actinomarinicola tropica]QGG94467.1 AMP-binding protein [Actinomarinicola tropica]
MYPGTHAATAPDRAAVIMGRSGEVITYRELDERSNRLAHLFRSAGLQRGDHVALFMENQPRFMEVVWAALRSGLYITAINSHLTAEETAYILGDCGARAFVTSRALAEVATGIDWSDLPDVRTRLAVDGAIDGFEAYESAVERQPTTPIDDESNGTTMLYSSGTTGRPKGVLRALPEGAPGDPDPRTLALGPIYGFREGMVYLSPAPMYHAAPLAFSINVHRVGGTVVIMERFDPPHALELIERHRVTHSQWVPTMFVRLLRLSEEERTAFDLSSHECAIHAAAPCPVPVKQQMIEWWGPIIYEYYAGTEGNGSTGITSEEWLAHPGSVGRARAGAVHIVGPDGEELGPREEGAIYFSGGGEFEYHNDPEKTRDSRDPKGRGWSTLGDVGYLDEDGWLYLTDRKAHMIISGGVNIYPREIEDVLIQHPAVGDVAVFGIPNEEFGEEVKAVVQPMDPAAADDALARELMAHCREHLAGYKCPRSVDFRDELPRLPTGKLYKRILVDEYKARAAATA